MDKIFWHDLNKQPRRYVANLFLDFEEWVLVGAGILKQKIQRRRHLKRYTQKLVADCDGQDSWWDVLFSEEKQPTSHTQVYGSKPAYRWVWGVWEEFVGDYYDQRPILLHLPLSPYELHPQRTKKYRFEIGKFCASDGVGEWNCSHYWTIPKWKL